MISKLLDQLSTDLVDFLKMYGIEAPTKYCPELQGILEYGRNFIAKSSFPSPITIDEANYSNKLLYRISTIKPASELAPALMSSNFSILNGYDQLSQKYTIERGEGGREISKIRDTSSDNGLVKTRDVSVIEMQVEFAFVTESIELLNAFSLLFYHQLINQTVVTVELDLFNDGNITELDYFLGWDRDSLNVSYASFSSGNTLNTVEFNLTVRGAGISEFYSENYIVDKINVKIGFGTKP